MNFLQETQGGEKKRDFTKIFIDTPKSSFETHSPSGYSEPGSPNKAKERTMIPNLKHHRTLHSKQNPTSESSFQTRNKHPSDHEKKHSQNIKEKRS